MAAVKSITIHLSTCSVTRAETIDYIPENKYVRTRLVRTARRGKLGNRKVLNRIPLKKAYAPKVYETSIDD